MAGEVQHHRQPSLGRAALRRGAPEDARLAPGADLSRHLGHRGVPVCIPPRAGHARDAAPYARMAPDQRHPRRSLCSEYLLDAADPFPAPARHHRRGLLPPGGPERGPGFLRGPAPIAHGPPEAMLHNGLFVPDPTAGTPARSLELRAPPAVAARRNRPLSAPAARLYRLERALAGPRGVAPSRRGGHSGGGLFSP